MITTYSYKSTDRLMSKWPANMSRIKRAGQFTLNQRDIEPMNMANVTIKSIFINLMTALKDNGKVTEDLYKKFMRSVNELVRDHKVTPPADASEYDSTMSGATVGFHTITALGRKKTDHSKGVSRAMSLVPGGTAAMAQYLIMLDDKDNFLGATAKVTIGNPGQSEVSVVDVALGHTDGVNALYMVHCLQDNGDDYVGGQYWQMEQWVEDPVIEAPVQKGNNVNYSSIVIGLGRGTVWLGVHGDADYSYGSQWDRRLEGQARVPFRGSANFGAAIEDIKVAGNLRAKLFLTTGSGEVKPIQFLNGKTWTDYITANGNTLTWNWPDNDLAYFGPVSWGVDKAAYVHFEVGVKTADSEGEFLYAQVHSMDKDIVPHELRLTDVGWGKEDQVEDGIVYIYPVEFAWHCVAAGTKVLTADGGEKNIEDIVGNDQLRLDAAGNSMEVRSTVQQDALPSDKVFDIKDEAGNTLTITGDHWLPLADGSHKLVEELAEGDELMTVNGPSKLASKVAVDYKGQLLTLSLGNHEERANVVFEGTTFAANNILVADNQLCRRLTTLRLKDPDHRVAGLNDEWKAIAAGMKDAGLANG